ncbi:hypothetical protein [Pseudobutyrivibrio xylanivorans]|uniref:hypothetical protein n=1 Tax=Pseudobutyrivibrio xylanivorans TaxID=185007 RepID=UPI0015A4A43F|nr:hypothetical protein [Pseudobutyrivibrio xylanivorans]
MAYIMSQIMLILISGQWWDDWVLWTYSNDNIIALYKEAGIPWFALNTIVAMQLPNWGYRGIVFLIFGWVGVSFYHILRHTSFLSEDDAFWMALVAMTAPVNEARATLICYNYSVSIALFMIAFLIVTNMSSGNSYLRLRTISIICLLGSYITESLLVFTALIWMYLLYKIWEENENETFTQKMSLFIRNYWDYVVLPFAFFSIKTIFFQPNGRYETYNNITIGTLLKGIFYSPIAALLTLMRIGRSYLLQINVISIILTIVIYIVILLNTKKRYGETYNKNGIDIRRNIKLFICGGVIFYVGLFAYLIIRGKNGLSNSGVTGRDTLLAGFGIGVMAVAFVRLLPIKRIIQNSFLIGLVVLGSTYFYEEYLNYQEDWYYQEEFGQAISYYSGFGNDNTILCEFATPSPNGATRFYTLNGKSYTITGKRDKFYFSNINDLHIGVDYEYNYFDGYNAEDYDSSDRGIDGILFVKNEPISNAYILYIRLNEIFDRQQYNKEICRLAKYSYYPINKDMSNKIYILYSDDKLTSEVLQKMIGL